MDILSWEDCGRIAPDVQVLKVCKQRTERAGQGSQGEDVGRVRGPEALAVEFHIFIVFSTLRADISHTNKE